MEKDTFVPDSCFSAKFISSQSFSGDEGGVYEFALSVHIEKEAAFDFLITADQYYRFFIDDAEVGRTLERGTFQRWFTDKTSCVLTAGEHNLKAIVWHCGEKCTAALLESHGLAFFLESSIEKEKFNTGTAPWKCRKLPDVTFQRHLIYSYGYSFVHAETTTDFRNAPDVWTPPAIVPFEYKLSLPMLPPPNDRIIDGFLEPLVWQKGLEGATMPELPLEPVRKLLKHEGMTIPPHTDCRILFRLADYDSGWPILAVSDGNGSRIALALAESLFECPESANNMEKGRIDEYVGKFFRGVKDQFVLDGSDHLLQPPVWRVGNYLRIAIQSGDEPLELRGLAWKSAPSALSMDGVIQTSDSAWNSMVGIAKRTLEMNSQDHITDCPYYEQLSYTGDGRLELLSSYVMSRNDALARKMIIQFADTAEANEAILCRTPSSDADILPSFSLWFVGIVHDYARWRNEPELVKQCLPALRKNMQYFLDNCAKDGLFRFKKNKMWKGGRYWDFIDWVPEWTNGVVSGDSLSADDGMNTIINWLLVYALRLSVELEEEFGSMEMAERYRAAAQRTVAALQPYCDESTGLYNLRGIAGEYAEHQQILSVLAGDESEAAAHARMERTAVQQGIARGSILFIHYLWEAAKKTGTLPLFFMPRWEKFLSVIKRGGRTFPETFYHPRSECHGWGAITLFTMTSILGGIAPDSWGFKRVLIQPELELLPVDFSANCPHHAGGFIKETIRHRQDGWQIAVSLPDGVEGVFRWKGIERKIIGAQTFEIV